MPGRRAIAGGGVALIALVAATGCDGGSDTDEPGDVVTASDGAEVQGAPARCVVADPESELILQPGSFIASERTRLISVALDDPQNLEVFEDSVVDYRGPEELQGVVLDYPPRANASFVEALADWESRHPLTGRVVRPHDGRQAVLVAVRLEDPSKPGHVRGVTVRARTAGGPHTMGWEQLVLVLPHGESCTAEVVAQTTEWTG